MRHFKYLITFVNNLSDSVGNIVCLIIFPMTFILVYEVIMRYGFNQPTIWAHETSQMLFGAHFILGGAFALRWAAHVNVEILYDYLSPRRRAIIDLFSWSLFYLFCGVMLWRGWEASWLSVSRWEHSGSFWNPPLWPLRLCVPLASALLLLQGFVKTINDMYMAVTGQQLVVTGTEKANRQE